MKNIILILLSIFLLPILAIEKNLYEDGVFMKPELETQEVAFPGDIIFTQTDGYKSECWTSKNDGDNKYCNIKSGTYCRTKDSVNKIRDYWFNVDTKNAVAYKHLNGSVGRYTEYLDIKGKGEKTKFSCGFGFGSFPVRDLLAEKNIKILGNLQKIEYVQKSGDTLRFLYFIDIIPPINNSVTRLGGTVSEVDSGRLTNSSARRELEINYPEEKFLYYKGLAIEILSVESGMINYRVLRPFK